MQDSRNETSKRTVPAYVIEHPEKPCVVCGVNPSFQMYSMTHLDCYWCYLERFERETLRSVARWGSE
jgi:hypothetical protein